MSTSFLPNFTHNLQSPFFTLPKSSLGTHMNQLCMAMQFSAMLCATVQYCAGNVQRHATTMQNFSVPCAAMQFRASAKRYIYCNMQLIKSLSSYVLSNINYQ